ncbi:unnamed protein product [Cunninghamella blakesleeana]
MKDKTIKEKRQKYVENNPVNPAQLTITATEAMQSSPQPSLHGLSPKLLGYEVTPQHPSSQAFLKQQQQQYNIERMHNNIHNNNILNNSIPIASSSSTSYQLPLVGIKYISSKQSYGLKKADLLSQLPFELISVIFIYLDTKDMVQLGSVNKYWKQLTNNSDDWYRRMHLHGWAIRLPDHWKQYITSKNQIDWRYWYMQRYQLSKRWHFGQATANYLLGHEDSVYCIQFDDRKIVSGSRDRTIRIWDIESFQCIRTLTGHEGSVLCLQYNEKYLVSGSSDFTVIVWSMQTLQQLMRIRGHTAKISDVCFNDKYIVSASKDTTIRVSSLRTGRLIHLIQAHSAAVNSVKLYKSTIVSASRDNVIKFWDINTGLCIRQFVGHEAGFSCIQYDGRFIVSGSNDQTIKVWNSMTGECLMTLEGHTGLVRALSFSNGRIVSAGYDQSIRVWDMASKTCLLNFQSGHTSWVFDVKFDEKRIISAGHDRRILVMNFTQGLDTRFICQ